MTVTPKIRATVIARDGATCQRCGVDLEHQISRGAYSLQHRKARGMGGSKSPGIDSPSNLVLLCGSGTTGCHGYIEAHRAEGRMNGWTLWQSDDPLLVAVRAPGDRWWFLNADGTRQEWTEDEGEMIEDQPVPHR